MYKEKYSTDIQISKSSPIGGIEIRKSQNLATTEETPIKFMGCVTTSSLDSVEKQYSPENLSNRINLDAHISVQAIDSKLSKLTRRQLQIIISIAAGKSRKAIAKELSLSENTIKAHAQTAYRILGISSRSAISSLKDPLHGC